MQYLYPILIEWLGAEDLEGTAALPEIMLPPPSQKPMVVKCPPEDCEEIRVRVAELMRVLVSTTEEVALRSFVDETVNILRALAMDPHGPVVQEACAAIGELAVHAKETVFHFSEVLARALLTALVHKHSKVRLAGIEALKKLMYVGVYKYNANIMEILIGFRDPNVVPIKAFYQPDTKFNYLASLLKDEKEVVREAFFKMLIQWMLDLPDKRDHEGRIVPYLLSGLYDPWESIEQLVFEQMEEIGRVREEENEKDFREYKQFDYHEEWTYNGDVESIELPFPFARRPRLGTRDLVKNYINRYLMAIMRELEDWQEENRERSVNLLLCSLVYAEDKVVQHIDKMFLPIYKALLQPATKVIATKLPLCLTLIGQYIKPGIYFPLVSVAIKGDLLSEYASSQLGSIYTIGYLLKGTVESFPSKYNFDLIREHVGKVFKVLAENCLDQINMEICEALVHCMLDIIKAIADKTSKNGDRSLLKDNEAIIFAILITAYAFVSSLEANPKTSDKLKAISTNIAACMNAIDSTITSESSFIIRNIIILLRQLLPKTYTGITKHSIELKQILLIYKVLTKEDLNLLVEHEGKELRIRDCAFVLVEKISAESKDKEVIMKLVGIMEALMLKYEGDLSLIAPQSVNALFTIYNADIDPKAVVALRGRIIGLFTEMMKVVARPLSEQIVSVLFGAAIKGLTMETKDIGFRKESMKFLCRVVEEVFAEEGKPQLLTAHKQSREILSICLDELWNKDEDIRLYASNCIAAIVNHYPAERTEADQVSMPCMVEIIYSHAKPKDYMTKVCELVKEEEKNQLEVEGTVEKMINFAVDEGGAPRENITKALGRVAKVAPIYLIKEYMKAIEQSFLVRIQFIRMIFKELLKTK
eukprot:TRINITY_DN1784_c0_g8_i2.p1 TRINITY_DN1784_c0_g8~~TRINITY_DN1784_c0_g8_i2.p1  ORF type:complete len:875 (+),score=299.36 TRINITY_DN1784_c0_g8_i2:535-3159(+)